MNFKAWLYSEGARTGAKIGLYPDIYDLLGQHPPLYGMPKAADYVTYLYLKFGKDGPPGENGIITSKPAKAIVTNYMPD